MIYAIVDWIAGDIAEFQGLNITPTWTGVGSSGEQVKVITFILGSDVAEVPAIYFRNADVYFQIQYEHSCTSKDDSFICNRGPQQADWDLNLHPEPEGIWTEKKSDGILLF